MFKLNVQGKLFASALPLDLKNTPTYYIEMGEEPVSDRGWCFQERMLSNRVLHFGRDQLYFECLEGFRSEDGIFMEDRFVSSQELRQSRHSLGSTQSRSSDLLQLWYRIVHLYSFRKLTNQRDKLTALGGIASLFAEKLEDQYFAGIWRKSMIEGLLWLGLPLTEMEEEKKPTWSWTAFNGVVDECMLGELQPLANVLDCGVELEGQNPFGTVRSGWMKLEASYVPVILEKSENLANDPGTADMPKYSKHLAFRSTRGNGTDLYARFDSSGRKHVETEGLARSKLIFALVLAKSYYEGSHGDRMYQALLVTPVDRKDGYMFRRVGFLLTEQGGLSEDELQTSRRTITLV